MPGSWGARTATGTEIVVHDVSASEHYLEANPGVVAEACFPLRAGGLTVGVLNVESREPLRDGDLEHLRECARALGARIDELGGLPSESGTQRLLRHVAEIADLQDAAAVADALLNAALDLVPLGSALLARTTAPAARCGRRSRSGPLADVLRAAPLESIGGVGRGRDLALHRSASTTRRAAANLAELRAAGVETLVAVGLFAHGELLGALVLASDEPAAIGTDDVELLEQLATHGAACLRTAELMGSLRERAETDPLTGLGHHATFHEALAGSHRRPTTAVVVCDIDGFKALNDTHGHGHGDRVLCGARRRHEQRAAPRRPALPRRRRRVRRAARRRRPASRRSGAATACATPSWRRGSGVTVSVGVAVPHAGETDVAVLARADRALYSVKAAGRDGVALANDEPLPVDARHRLSRLGQVAAHGPDAYPESPYAWQTRRTSATSRSSPTSTTASRRWPTASSRSRRRSIRAQMREQLLDSMDLERERGITIKAQAVRVFYEARDGETYQLHLIDTPGHVDFTYEVSRSLAACEGALLVVDASQGVEAQTLANTYLAVDAGLELIPCLNKIDLPGAEPERVAEEVSELLGEPADTIRRISGKTGEGVEDVLEELVAEGAAAGRRPRRPAARADLRLRVRPVPRRGRLHPRRRRRLSQGRGDPRDGRRAPRPRSTTSASSRRR